MITIYKVKITRVAEKDLNDIWDYISKDSIQNAQSFLIELENQIKTLKNFPNRCPIIPESEMLGIEYRHLIIGNYRIIIKIVKNIVYIMRIIHSSRLLQ
jgi:plasmid stabilization system protein ParE